MEFRGEVTTSLGRRESFLCEGVFEDVQDLKAKAYYVSFIFCWNKSSQTLWLKIAHLLSYGTRAQKFRICLSEPKSRCQQDWFLLETMGESVSLPFPASRNRLLFLALGPVLHLQSQQCGFFKQISVIILSWALTLLPPSFPYKNTSDHLGPS